MYQFENSKGEYVTVDLLTRSEINVCIARIYRQLKSSPNDEILLDMLKVLENA